MTCNLLWHALFFRSGIKNIYSMCGVNISKCKNVLKSSCRCTAEILLNHSTLTVRTNNVHQGAVVVVLMCGPILFLYDLYWMIFYLMCLHFHSSKNNYKEITHHCEKISAHEKFRPRPDSTVNWSLCIKTAEEAHSDWYGALSFPQCSYNTHWNQWALIPEMCKSI